MSIEVLLQAAEFIERRERAEHDYASSGTISDSMVQLKSACPLNSPNRIHLITASTSNITCNSHSSSKKHSKTRRGMGNRFTHNELEKNRRANLRHCLERLREQVPPSPDSSRHTTLGLLTRAREFIMMLEDRDRLNRRYKDQLIQEQRVMARQLDEAQSLRPTHRQIPVPSATSSSLSMSAGLCGTGGASNDSSLSMLSSSYGSTSSGYESFDTFESHDSDETDSLNSAIWTSSSRASGDSCSSLDITFQQLMS